MDSGGGQDYQGCPQPIDTVRTSRLDRTVDKDMVGVRFLRNRNNKIKKFINFFWEFLL